LAVYVLRYIRILISAVHFTIDSRLNAKRRPARETEKDLAIHDSGQQRYSHNFESLDKDLVNI
jgi:hypothetical protein